MSTFAFKALDLTGASTRGEVEAEDKQSVAAQLRAKGLIVLDIEEQKPTDVGTCSDASRRSSRMS
jgi:type II secretory pathway component PulF